MNNYKTLKSNNLRTFPNLKFTSIFKYSRDRVCWIECHSCLHPNVVYVPTCFPYMSAWFTCQLACVLEWFMCQCACMPTFHFYVSTCQWTCQCAKRHASVSTGRTNLPKGVTIFQTFLLRNAERNFYALLLYKKFLIILDTIVMQIICICAVHKNCIMLTSILPVVSKSVEFFHFFYFIFLFFMFSSFVKNIKVLGFYTLQVTMVFSNFAQLKQLNKIKNNRECCDLLELWSAWIGAQI